MLTLNLDNTASFVREHELEYLVPQLNLAHKMLQDQEGPGSDYLGWVKLPEAYDRAEYARILEAAARIRETADVLVVVGIGGSYLGARAVIEALGNNFGLGLSKEARKGPAVVFAGYNLSGTYHAELFDYLADKDVVVNVISKSGTTTEPAVAFRLFKQYIESRYGQAEAKERIYVTTDKARGALKGLADQEGYESFVVPDDVGGRFSVLTAVGLLPIAVSGVDVDQLMKGAEDAMQEMAVADPEKNSAWRYAATRTSLLRRGYAIEIMVNYEPQLHFFSEWWKQLYGESEGKDGRGLFPAAVDFTADLHSMGQFVQDGSRNLFETVIRSAKPKRALQVPLDPENLDGLNFLADMDLAEVNNRAIDGTILAHVDGGVPNLAITVDRFDAYHLGYLIYFFEYACGLSGHLNAVNPFDQPGVEDYKKNMFALLGKPGFEELREKLEERL